MVQARAVAERLVNTVVESHKAANKVKGAGRHE
jgi:hypothetical protein